MILLLLLVSLFAVGCGDSGEDFVVVGNNANNNNPQVPTTTVNFQFAQAQQVNITANVPLATTRLHIDFLASDSREVFETEVDFSPTVSVNGVPITATQAQVTALDRNGIPLRTIFYSLTLTAGQTANAVPLGPGFPVTFESVTASPNPLALGVNSTQQLILSVNFSNGNSLSGSAAGGTASFTSAKPTVANVTSTGLVRGVTNGTATINVAYSLNNVTKNSTVSVTVGNGGGGGSTTGNTTGSTTGNTTGSTTGNTTGTTTGNTTGGTAARLVLDQENIFVATGGMSGQLSGVFYAANSTVGVAVGGTTANAFAGVATATTPTGTQANWTYQAATNRVIATSAAENNSIDYTITFTPVNGPSASDTIKVTAVNGTDPRLSTVQSVRINSLKGSTLKLPVGSTYPLGILEVLGTGSLNQVTNANILTTGPGTAGQYVVASSSGSVTYNTGVLTFSGTGNATITVTRNNTANNGPTSVGTIATTTVDATLFNVSAGQFNSTLTLTGGSTGPSGSAIPYKIELAFTDGSRQDITPVQDAILGTGGGGWVVNQEGTFFSGSVTIGTTPQGNTVAQGTTPVTGFSVPGISRNTSPLGLTRTP